MVSVQYQYITGPSLCRGVKVFIYTVFTWLNATATISHVLKLDVATI